MPHISDEWFKYLVLQNIDVVPIYRLLDTVGDGSGLKNMARVADNYDIIAPADKVIIISRMLVSYQDTVGGLPSEYADLGVPLTNGIDVQIIDDDNSTVIVDLTDGLGVKFNAAWGVFCYDHKRVDYGTVPDDLFLTRWTFAKSGKPLKLTAGQRLRIAVGDDLTGLISHYVQVQGYQYDAQN